MRNETAAKPAPTVEAVIEELVEQATKTYGNRYQLHRTQLSGNYQNKARTYSYSLRVAGGSGYTRSYWRGSIALPDELGEVLHASWNTSTWGHYIGVRGAKRILKDLGQNVAGIDAMKKAKEQAAERAKERRIAQHRIEKLDKFLADNGTWLDGNVAVAVQQQLAVLASKVAELTD